MAFKINFTCEGTTYCLEYTKKSVKMMEDRGFRPSQLLEAPMTYLPELFAGAFLANHKFVSRETIEKIFDAMGNKKELLSALIEMYNEPISALTQDADEGNAIAWERV